MSRCVVRLRLLSGRGVAGSRLPVNAAALETFFFRCSEVLNRCRMIPDDFEFLYRPGVQLTNRSSLMTRDDCLIHRTPDHRIDL